VNRAQGVGTLQDLMKQTYNNLYPKFLVKQSYNIFLKKNTLKKFDLQESYNNFNIKLKIYFCESKDGPRSLRLVP